MTVNNEYVETVAGARSESQKVFRISKQGTVVAVGLGLIVLLGTFLRFYELGAYSIGNTYYAATVQSMLTLWRNFFFVSFEPGGSVTVDKPPLGFWIQAVSAYFLGVNGFALALPQALAGVLSIPLLYALVKRQFGVWAGLIAALAVAVMPVAVSTERNNTIDGLLVFALLLATWAFWRATRSGRLRDLLLGAVLVGLGFNIKMLQAFLPLPAFYLLYLLGARQRWWKRILYLGIATVVLVAVCLSWAIVVDLTPTENRPYIGSSTNNTVMELIVGHNGLKRLNLSQLFGADGDNGQPPAPPGGGSMAQPGLQPIPNRPGNPPLPPPGFHNPSGNMSAPPGDGSMTQPGLQPIPNRPGNPLPPGFHNPSGNMPAPPGGNPMKPRPQNRPFPPPGGPGNAPAPRGGRRHDEVGEPGWLRLFTAPLVTEAGWLLPVALLGIPLVLVVLGRPWPLTEKHLALVLWAGWLLPEVVYFTFNSGLFHAYYLIMLGPPLAALVGATAWALWRVLQRRRWLGWALTGAVAGVTLFAQLGALRDYPAYAGGVIAVVVPLLIVGLALLALAVWRRWMGMGRIAYGIAILSLMIAPLLWSGLTAFNANPNVALPRSGPATRQSVGPTATKELLSPAQEAILDYLLAHTEPNDYLVATLSSHDASPYILATSRPVLTFGGFNGGDNVVDADQLSEMVADGELRFVLGGQELAQRKPEIGEWVQTNCTVVNVPGMTMSDTDGRAFGPGRGQATALYDCGV